MRRYLSAGLTQQQIADKWQEDSGERVSRSAVAMAIERYGLESTNPRPRYDDLLWWRVTAEHLYHRDARMLRLESRRRQKGEASISHHELSALKGWLADLEDSKAVVHYDPKTTEGFWWVHRDPSDTDIVRKKM